MAEADLPTGSSPVQDPPSRPVRVLVVDDDEVDREMMRRYLRQAVDHVAVGESPDARTAIEMIGADSHDCVLLDYRLPDQDGLDLLRHIRETHGPSPPVVMLTSQGDERLAVELMKAGATDYIPKSAVSAERLGAAVRASLRAQEQQRKVDQAHAALLHSVRELVRLNEELTRRNRELDEFSTLAAHDLQEPLRNMLIFSQRLEKHFGGSVPEQARQDIWIITSSARRMQQCIQGLQVLNQVGKSKFHCQRVSLKDCAQRALSSLEPRVRESSATVLVADLPDVVGDESLLIRLYESLLENALKFKGPAAPEIHLTADLRDRVWVLGVKDNGIGIHPEHAERVFDPLETLHGRDQYDGVGMGLAICRKVVERHGGRLWVESEPGRGAHFRFLLNIEGDGGGSGAQDLQVPGHRADAPEEIRQK